MHDVHRCGHVAWCCRVCEEISANLWALPARLHAECPPLQLNHFIRLSNYAPRLSDRAQSTAPHRLKLFCRIRTNLRIKQSAKTGQAQLAMTARAATVSYFKLLHSAVSITQRAQSSHPRLQCWETRDRRQWTSQGAQGARRCIPQASSGPRLNSASINATLVDVNCVKATLFIRDDLW